MQAASYKEAQIILKRNQRTKSEEIITWDAGDGWTGRGQYCNRRKRIVTVSINPAGFEVI